MSDPSQPDLTDPSISFLTSQLGSLFAIKLHPPTSRLFLGEFTALDKQGNLVLDRAIEFEDGIDLKMIERGQAGPGREVGMILVKKEWWKEVSKVEFEDIEHHQEQPRRPQAAKEQEQDT